MRKRFELSSQLNSSKNTTTINLHLPLTTQSNGRMAPKQQRITVQKADPRRPAPRGYFSSAYNSLTSAENASVVRSVAVFGVRTLHNISIERGQEGDQAAMRKVEDRKQTMRELSAGMDDWETTGKLSMEME